MAAPADEGAEPPGVRVALPLRRDPGPGYAACGLAAEQRAAVQAEGGVLRVLATPGAQRLQEDEEQQQS